MLKPREQAHNRMARGKTKCMSESDRKALLAETVYVDGKPFANMKGMRILCNALIDDGSSTLERCMGILQQVNHTLAKPKTLVPCSFCGMKLGLKQCSGCSQTGSARYCSRECQLQAWPKHKAICRDQAAQT